MNVTEQELTDWRHAIEDATVAMQAALRRDDTARRWRKAVAAGKPFSIYEDAEKEALAAGTHEPAVDDFGNQYLALRESQP